MKQNKKIFLTYFVLSLITILFVSFGIVLLYRGFRNYTLATLSYMDSPSLKYKVYLKPNDFFDEDYLDENSPYLTNLIDYINVNYNYNIKFDKAVSGNYIYYITASIKSYEKNSTGNPLWVKNYVVKESQTIPFKSIYEYTLLEPVKVDYNLYNDYLKDFESTAAKIALDSYLYVNMVVKTNIECEEISDKIENNIEFKIPLSQLAVDATVTKKTNIDSKTIIKKIISDDYIFVVCKAFGIVFVLIGLYSLSYIIRINKLNKLKNKYFVELKKILKVYDSIIVNIAKMPNLEDLNVIKVKSFNELIDAHGEVRMPINFYENEDKNKSYFTLISESNAWIYVLECQKSKRKRRKEKYKEEVNLT